MAQKITFDDLAGLDGVTPPYKKGRYDVMCAEIPVERAAEGFIECQEVCPVAVRREEKVFFKGPVKPYTPDDVDDLKEVAKLCNEDIETPLPGRERRALMVESGGFLSFKLIKGKLQADFPFKPKEEFSFTPNGEDFSFEPIKRDYVLAAGLTALLQSLPSTKDPALDPYPLPEGVTALLPHGWALTLL